MHRTKIIKPERTPLKQKTVTIRSEPVLQNKQYKADPERDRRDRQERFARSLQPNANQRPKPERQEFRKYGKIEQDLRGKSVYIIAGGPSLTGFDFNRLAGKNVIVINKAFMYVPEFQYLYWTDARFYNWYKNEIDQLQCKKFTPCTSPRDLPDSITVLKNSGGRTIDLSTPDTITAGNNSGFGAISLAIKLGATEIYLLGYDMGYNGNQTHFHDGYPAHTAKQGVYKSMLKYFEDNAEIIKSVVKIYNTSAQSSLTYFEYINIDTAISST
jgi:hypothetical protein